MSIKELFGVPKNDPYNKANEKWKQLKEVNHIIFPDKFLILLLEVISQCKIGIKQSPNWGDQYVLLANSYYALGMAFPDLYWNDSILSAHAVIHKWLNSERLINKDNRTNGFTIAVEINHELIKLGLSDIDRLPGTIQPDENVSLKAFSNEPIENKLLNNRKINLLNKMKEYAISDVDLSSTGKLKMKKYCNQVTIIINKYSEVFNIFVNLHNQLLHVDSSLIYISPENKDQLKYLLAALLIPVKGIVDLSNPEENRIDVENFYNSPPGSWKISFELYKINQSTHSIVEIYERTMAGKTKSSISEATEFINVIKEHLQIISPKIKETLEKLI